MRARTAFTLPELLVVMLIIGLVSVIVLPGIVSAIGERSVVSGAALLQASLNGARDTAIRTNAPAGIRLLPDPTLPNACNRWVALEIPPAYSDGLVSIRSTPWPLPLPTPLLVVETCGLERWSQDPISKAWLPILASPPSFWWNARVGDRITIGTNHPFTIVGPVVNPNVEQFANIGNPGAASPVNRTFTAPDGVTTIALPVEYLWLVNGLDDDHDGFVDNGYDGVTGGYEVESWPQALANGTDFAKYILARRAAPLTSGVVVSLPSGCVIDLTDRSKSRLPVNPDGSVDVLVNPNGTLAPSRLYSSPTARGLGSEFLQFWLADRSDVGLPATHDARLITLNGRTGRVSTFDPAGIVFPFDPHVEAIK